MTDLAQFEADLWEAADNLRANSKLTSSDYFMPVLGVIFLRHAANRFDAATKQIADDQAAGRMPKRKIQPADYLRRRALWLPETARYDYIMDKASVDPAGLPKLVTGAMTAIEADFEPLSGVLPKDYGIFEPKVLEDLMRLFNSDQVKHATGDVFGRIYEYFLAKFSIQKAHDNGEFFTPSSLVQTIVNVIEPDHGIVFDPAIGSAGMAVQSSHFIENHGGDTSRQVVIYGQEKNRDTIRIAKMNLAVHGLEGKIAEAITYYQDEHNLVGKCDFVMANPPFNVDLVDAERIAKDPRLPFGLPGVNKGKKVSNGNYLWISYFWSYLSDKGRAGFVMSSQASSAGNDEKEVRKKIIESGDVDVMVSIRSGFFYTRTVPCELWFFDRSKSSAPSPTKGDNARRAAADSPLPGERGKGEGNSVPQRGPDTVLMLDARSIGQLMKGSRKVYELTPEELQNIAAIVWLYRGQRDRFLALVTDYFTRLCAECAAVPEKLAAFDAAYKSYSVLFVPFEDSKEIAAPLAELRDASKAYQADRTRLLDDLAAFVKSTSKNPPASNDKQRIARKAFDPVAERIKGIIKQVDLLYKLASRTIALADDLPPLKSEISNSKSPDPTLDTRQLRRLLKQLDEQRRAAVEQLKRAAYFYRHIVWLHDRFPDAEMQPVPGLVKVVTRKDIAEADWSLTPGRYVGVAPAEVDDAFDFEQAISDIHTELAALNKDASGLARTIQRNFEELGGMTWKQTSLEDVVSDDRGLIQTGPFGSQLHQSDYTPEGIPVIMPTDISDGRVLTDRIARVSEQTADRLSRHKLKPRTIVLPRRGEITKRAFIRDDQEGWLCGSGCLKIEVQETDLLPEFLYYYMAQHDVVQWLEQHAVGSTMLNLSAGIVNQMPVRHPPLQVQGKIAHTLFAYDDLLENNRRRMALLETAARLIYQEWFVRLRFPGHEHTPKVNGIPQGWERVPTPEAIEVNPQTRLSDDDEHWWVEMADLPTDSMTIQNAIKREGRSGSKFRNGDTLLARITPCLENGKTGFVNFMADGEAGRGSTEFIVLRSKRVPPEFVYCLARTYTFRENAVKSMVGSSGRQRVQESCFEKFMVWIPPHSLLNLFSEFAEPVFQHIKVLHGQNQKLRAARDLLLPRLMSGEITI